MNNQSLSERFYISNSEEIDKAILYSIHKITEEFKAMPYDFFYEEDIRSRLYNILKDSVKYKIPIPKERFGTKDWEGEITINPVKAEYSQANGYRSIFNEFRFDIAILDKNEEHDFYLWPCIAIIEIKYSTNDIGCLVSGHKDNIRKIENYNSQSSVPIIRVAIHFDLYKKFSLEDINNLYRDLSIEFTRFPNDESTLSSKFAHIFYIQSDGIIYYAKKELKG